MVSTTTCLILCMAGASGAEAHTDYYAAYRQARDGKRMLLIDMGVNSISAPSRPRSCPVTFSARCRWITESTSTASACD